MFTLPRCFLLLNATKGFLCVVMLVPGPFPVRLRERERIEMCCPSSVIRASLSSKSAQKRFQFFSRLLRMFSSCVPCCVSISVISCGIEDESTNLSVLGSNFHCQPLNGLLRSPIETIQLSGRLPQHPFLLANQQLTFFGKSLTRSSATIRFAFISTFSRSSVLTWLCKCLLS